MKQPRVTMIGIRKGLSKMTKIELTDGTPYVFTGTLQQAVFLGAIKIIRGDHETKNKRDN